MIQHIEYDLARPGQDYGDLIAAIKGLGDCARPTKSSWLVQTEMTTVAVRDQLWQHIDSNDRLLVLDVTGKAWAWKGLPTDVAAWVKAHM